MHPKPKLPKPLVISPQEKNGKETKKFQQTTFLLCVSCLAPTMMLHENGRRKQPCKHQKTISLWFQRHHRTSSKQKPNIHHRIKPHLSNLKPPQQQHIFKPIQEIRKMQAAQRQKGLKSFRPPCDHPFNLFMLISRVIFQFNNYESGILEVIFQTLPILNVHIFSLLMGGCMDDVKFVPQNDICPTF